MNAGDDLLAERRVALGALTELALARRGSEGDAELVMVHRLLPYLRTEEGLASRFLQRGQRACTVAHSAVTPVLDIRNTPRELALVSSYHSGESLDVIVGSSSGSHRRATPLRFAGHVIVEAGRGLHAAHERGLLHLDLRPSHILVTYDGEVKVLEIALGGLDPLAERARPGTKRVRVAHTAPEVLDGGDPDRRSDVYALGVLAWELFARRPLYLAQSPAETAARVRRGQPPPPSRTHARVTPRIDEVILTAIDVDPAKRFTSARALADALEEAIGGAVEPAQIGRWMSTQLATRKAEREELEREVETADPEPSQPSKMPPPVGFVPPSIVAPLPSQPAPAQPKTWLWASLAAVLSVACVLGARLFLVGGQG